MRATRDRGFTPAGGVAGPVGGVRPAGSGVAGRSGDGWVRGRAAGAVGFGLLVAAACGGPTSSKEEPVLSVTPLVLDFGDSRNSITVTVSNGGTGSFHWVLTIPSEGWITVNRQDGTVINSPMDVEVRIDREKAPAGTQEIRLTITGAGATQEITVRAVVRHAAQLSLSPLSLDFGETSTQQQVTVRNTGVRPWPGAP
ncbi:MAG: hypothetical protein AB1505_35410 [Candidatus Latescibacterota bacterium]